RIGLGRADDGVAGLAELVLDLDLAPQGDAVLGTRLLDDLRVADHLLKPQDAALDPALGVLGVLVLGVLGDVAEVLGGADAVRDLEPADVAQLIQLGLELLQALLGDGDGSFLHGAHTCKQQRPARVRSWVGHLRCIRPSAGSADYSCTQWNCQKRWSDVIRQWRPGPARPGQTDRPGRPRTAPGRSEERRVGKEWRWWWGRGE